VGGGGGGGVSRVDCGGKNLCYFGHSLGTKFKKSFQPQVQFFSIYASQDIPV
jgi:hypothetical protein